MRKTISVVAGCYNEQENVDELYSRVLAVFDRLDRYDFELILIDNASQDATVERLRALAQRDPRVKIILNSRNFGHIRSAFHALMQARGDAVIALASDLQDPPELIETFLSGWEQGYKKVVAVKPETRDASWLFPIRRLFYRSLNRISEMPLIENFTGFGLYDRVVIEHIRAMKDPYPYFRGMITEVGYSTMIVQFEQPRRERGVTSSNFMTLYDIAMLGITNHSKLPLRIATITGFFLSALTMLVALGYFVYKLLRWDDFAVGQAPLVIGLFLFFSVQLLFIGLLGEYVLSIHRHVLNRPLVVEQERINF
jgi:glycosyltransferase involved in cell wall biosynthesis